MWSVLNEIRGSLISASGEQGMGGQVAWDSPGPTIWCSMPPPKEAKTAESGGW